MNIFEEPVNTWMMDFEGSMGEDLKACEENVVRNWR